MRIPSAAIRLLHTLDRILDDRVMGLLALVVLMHALAPLAFDLTGSVMLVLGWSENAILLVFFVEYAVALTIAEDRRRFVTDRWRLLDAAILAAAALSMLPLASDRLAASPALRLVRFVRVAFLSARTGLRASAAPDLRGGETLDTSVTDYRALKLQEMEAGFEPVDWGEAQARLASAQTDWLYLANPGAEQLAAVARIVRIPERALRGRLYDLSFPQLERHEQVTALFTWYPEFVTDPSGSTDIRRTALLLLGSESNVVLLARGASGLPERLEDRLRETSDNPAPPLVAATTALIAEVVAAYGHVVSALEQNLATLEADEARLGDREFLARTWRLRTESTRVRTNLRHLAAAVRQLNTRRIAIADWRPETSPELQMLAAEVNDLFERAEDLGSGLAALVDMRLNVSSFQMNKVMRLLAILTTLALIPSVVGGMLGMNLLDNPWSATLPQVGFWVGSGMLVSLYLFAVKGWLR